MLLTLRAELSPGSDLGHLLHKHPDRVFSTELSAGRAHVFYPELSEHAATAALWLDVDPIGLVRRQHDDGLAMDQYVNDRPYVASSLLSVAISRCLSSALNGRCEARPELAETPLRLTARVSVLASRGGPGLIEQMFLPLGYTVSAERQALDSAFPDWGESPYYVLTLQGHKRLSELLNHLYVLLPALDRHKHYYFGDDEVDKLLRRGAGWLAEHPAQELIARRYLQDKRSLTRQALERLLPAASAEPVAPVAREEELEKPLSLNEQRIQRVLEVLNQNQVQSVADLGCGEGRILQRLLRETRIPRLIGIDVASRELERADRRFRRLSEAQAKRVSLLQGSVLYRDARWCEVDAALLIEVIEHLEPFQLERLGRTLFGEQKPPLVLVSTPNREYNARFGMLPHQLRHADHRFEWTRQEFHRWAKRIAERYGYLLESQPIGEADPELGPPTQMIVFSRQEAKV